MEFGAEEVVFHAAVDDVPGENAIVRPIPEHEEGGINISLCGGGGVFSIAANVAPRLTSALHNALRTGNVDAAYALQDRLTPLLTALEQENSVACAKDALSLILGLSAEVRLPLTPPSLDVQRLLRRAIAALPERAELMSRTA